MALSRRSFLARSSTLAAAAFGFPAIIPGSALGLDGAVPPSGRIAFGVIGLGTIGGEHIKNISKRRNAVLAAICDVDAPRIAKGLEDARTVRAQAAAAGSGSGLSAESAGDPATHADWRELVARADLDAIVVATPDHWHGVMAVAVANAGKDVYCEKPLAYSVAEGRAICDAVERNGRVLQTGTWQRSIPAFRHACELVRNGRIGKVHTVKVGPGGVADDFCWPSLPAMPVPAGFDYEMWLGPAPQAPYTEKRCHFHFRWNFDYAGGMVTDVGAHHVDIAQWGLGTESTGPVRVEGKCEWCRGALANVAKTYELTYTYADDTKMIVASALPGAVRFEGEHGWVWAKGWDQYETYPASLKQSVIRPDEIHLMNSTDHLENFIQAVQTRRQPIAPAETAHRNATICNIGNISLRLGRALNWDPQAEAFVNDEEANRYLDRPMRAPGRV